MAIVRGGQIPEVIIGARLSTVILSGTVKVATVGVSRLILIYKNSDTSLLTSTISDSSGDWSAEVGGGTNDKFRIICIGADGENSEIFESVIK